MRLRELRNSVHDAIHRQAIVSWKSGEQQQRKRYWVAFLVCLKRCALEEINLMEKFCSFIIDKILSRGVFFFSAHFICILTKPFSLFSVSRQTFAKLFPSRKSDVDIH